MAAIQKLAKQALITFRTKESPTFASNFEILKNLLDNLTAEDINLEVPKEESEDIIRHPSGAPVSHIGIYECPYFSMGVFIIKKGCEIPLHDHPGMYGLCKVLYGKLRIRSYNLLNAGSTDDRPTHQPFNGHGLIQRKPIICQSPNDYTFDASKGTCVLTPKTGNYHSVHSVPGPTAFLDILAPPYEPDKDRDCTYYKEYEPELENNDVMENGDEKTRIRWLIPVNAPRDFYCDSQQYMGPKIEL